MWAANADCLRSATFHSVRIHPTPGGDKMSHNDVQVRAVMHDRLREAQQARVAIPVIRARAVLRARQRARRRAERFARLNRRRSW